MPVICSILLPPASEGWGRLYFHFVCQSTPRWGMGESQVQVQVGRVPNPAMDGGVPGLRFSGGGGSRSQIFFGGGSPVSVKGKIFDTRFGLIHVQTGEKFFCQGTPTPPP